MVVHLKFNEQKYKIDHIFIFNCLTICMQILVFNVISIRIFKYLSVAKYIFLWHFCCILLYNTIIYINDHFKNALIRTKYLQTLRKIFTT